MVIRPRQSYFRTSISLINLPWIRNDRNTRTVLINLSKNYNCIFCSNSPEIRLKLYKKTVMDRVKGWFWSDSTKSQGNQDDITSAVVLPETDKNQRITENVTDKNQRNIEKVTDKNQRNTESVTDKNQRNIEKVTKENSDLNKNKSAQGTQVDNIEPVFYDNTNLSLNKRTLQWLQKYTYLQPDDCLFCKLTGTTCATLLGISGFSAYKSLATKGNIGTGRRRLSYVLIFAMWATFMYKEWYNAVFLPPGDLPRSFIQSEKVRIQKFREFLKENMVKNEQDSDQK